MLVGRERELQRVTTLLDDARRGRSGTLVVVGDAGVGKTALLQHATRAAADMRVLAATGVESESELPFASLHALLRPLLGLLPRIPEAQARSLAAALALADGTPNRLAANAGTLSLLVEAAEETPVAIVVDDVHWLDQASAEALAFTARRLAGEELAVLVSARSDTATVFEAFPRLELGPLVPADARRLLESRTLPVPRADVVRFLAAAAGNPLALLELPAELAGELPSSTTPHDRLRHAFTQRLEDLSEQSRLGLLLVAAEPDPQVVLRAAEGLGVLDPLAEVEAAGLARLDGDRVAFRHPVVRSLVYAGADAADRRAAHRALADALPSQADRDRRAWHLAAAVEGADEGVAALLEQTAERAAARGGLAARAQALQRAARLSPGRADRARRLHAAAGAVRGAGDSARALELVEEGLRFADDPLVHADLVELFGAIRRQQDADVSELVFLRELEVDGLDDERIAKLLRLVVDVRLYALDAVGAAALAPRLETAARAASWHEGVAYAASAFLLAGERERAARLYDELTSDPTLVALQPWDFLWLERYDELRTSFEQTLRDARARGNQVRIAFALAAVAHLELRQGRLTAAAAAAAEAIPLADAMDISAIAGIASGALAVVHAWRGQAGACESQAGAALAAAQKTGDSYQQGVARHALALLALGANRPEDAVAELEPLARRWAASSVVEPSFVPYLPDLVEARFLTGASEDATGCLERFAKVTTDAGRTWALAACARCDGLLASADGFDEHFVRALELLERTPLALERARTELAYGERLRRNGERRDARRHLRNAYDAFTTAGAAPWQARAAAELRATGVQVGSETRPLPDLTPQELHIANLVAEGKTNKEIAAALYLSPKTIQYHLANAFRKLDIHSRAELARIVARGDQDEQ